MAGLKLIHALRFWGLTIAFPFCLVAGPEGSKGETSSVVLQLTFTVKEYDPAKPSGSLTCTVVNQSPKPIKIPTRYNGIELVLFGQGQGHRWASAMRAPLRQAKSQAWKELPSKGKLVLLELPFKNLLPQVTAKGRLARPQWGWDWRARPAPPMSPITQPRSHQLIPKATFWVQARIGKEVVVSNKVFLTVKISR